ncbi:uncharacterized protein LOC141849277 [Brevipalpus obovatus]|uniref:uncharacterized protein LOC141849277 n=1 Tax=Brevipalpus obovatus TaxID=246614 RepID=UPI003D9EAC96
MRMFCSRFLAFFDFLSYANGIDIRGKMIMGEHQLDRMCFKMSQMKSLGRSEIEVQKFLRDEIAHRARVITQEESSDRGYSYPEDPDSGQLLDVSTNTEVGQGGHFYQIHLTGTDESTGTYTATSVQEHVNNYFESADVSDFLLFVRGRVGSSRNDVTKVQAAKKRKSKVLEPIKRTENGPLTKNECRKMLQTSYNMGIRDPVTTRKAEASKKADKKAAGEYSLDRSKYSGSGGNTTSIDNRMKLGPGSVGTFIGHFSRGQASNTASASNGELQVHGTYKDSDVSLETISLNLAAA